MTIHRTDLTQPGQVYFATPSGIDVPAAHSGGPWRHGSSDGATNPHVLLIDTPRPSGITAANCRHTLSFDVACTADFLNLGHGGLVSRHSGADYTGFGDNQSGSAIFGAFTPTEGGKHSAKSLGAEEIELGLNPYTGVNDRNHHPKGLAGVFPQHAYVNVTVDTIYLNGVSSIEVRTHNQITGVRTEFLTNSASQIASAYASASKVTSGIFALHGLTTNASHFQFANVRSYWSLGSEWVGNP